MKAGQGVRHHRGEAGDIQRGGFSLSCLSRILVTTGQCRPIRMDAKVEAQREGLGRLTKVYSRTVFVKSP